MMAASARRRTILVTGFQPFLAHEHNASADLARDIAYAARHAFPDYATVARVLPTEWAGAARAVRELYDALQPHIALHFGISSKAVGFEIETRGVNRTCQAEDAIGRLPGSDVVHDGGPPTLNATIPSRLILARLRGLGLPVSLSRDAGDYVCNSLLYRALMPGFSAHSPRACGFVHIPSSLRIGGHASAEGADTSLTAETAIAGGLAILQVTLAARLRRRHVPPAGTAHA